MISRHEDKINQRFCNILSENGLDATPLSEHHGNKRIDIEAVLGTIHVAIECEKYGPYKRSEAVKDASSRLVPHRLVDVALAVVYPKECDNEEDLFGKTVIDYAVVIRENAIKYGLNNKKHARSLQWGKCRVDAFHNVVTQLPRNLGDPDIMALDLKRRLDMSIQSLSKTHYRKLSKAVDSVILDVENHETLEVTASKRALLIVASAALFHARLDDHVSDLRRPSGTKMWPPYSLQACYDANNTKVMLSEAWGIILKYDYRPIFESARGILAVSSDVRFVGVVESMVRWALDTVGQLGGMRHDLLGRLFHAVIDTAQNDGSFYTTTPAAVLLAHIALRDKLDLPENVSKMRVLDPSCGTGTLLMAAGERIRELTPDMPGNVLIENVLNGVDINMTATHMAATTLGLLSPSTKFGRMNISVAPFGVDGKGVGRAGSLEMYSDDGLLPTMDWFTGPAMQVDTGNVVSLEKHSVDLLIMNPPFTRNSLRHKQLDKITEEKIKKRETGIFAKTNIPVNKSSSGPMFMALAEKMQNVTGTLAVVRPAMSANDYSERDMRPFLAEKYHVDTIIAPHDPERFWFSENTGIWEILVILRRGRKKNTRIINLIKNPATVVEAVLLAEQINSKRQKNGEGMYNEIAWSRSHVVCGDWSGMLFLSPFLGESFSRVRSGNIFKTERLGDVSTMIDPRQSRGAFNPSDIPDRYARFVLHGNNTNENKSLRAKPNKYLVEKFGKEKKANAVWTKAALLQITERTRLNTASIFAVMLDSESVGTSWYSVKPRDADARQWSKAMAVYLNSTLGVLVMLGIRSPRVLSYPRYSKDALENMPIPVLTAKKLARLVKIYERYKDDDLGLLQNPSSTRVAIDEAVCKVFGVDTSLVTTIRREISKEPMVTDRRYGESALDSFMK